LDEKTWRLEGSSQGLNFKILMNRKVKIAKA
jgi:hypothetical protein